MEKTELTNAQKQNRVRQRITQASIDLDKYEYFPAKEQNDHVKADLSIPREIAHLNRSN